MSPSVSTVVDTSSPSTPACVPESAAICTPTSGLGLPTRAAMARSTSVEMRVPSSSAWLLPATEVANSVRPRRSPLQGSRVRQRTAVRQRPARPCRRDPGHHGSDALDPGLHPGLRCHPALRQLFPDRGPDRPAASCDVGPPAREVDQRPPARRCGGDQPGRAARSPDAGVEHGQVEAGPFPVDGATDQPGQGEPLAPSRGRKASRSFGGQAIALQPLRQRIPQPVESRIVECRHGRSLTSRPGGADGRPTGNAQARHPAPVDREGLRRSRGSALRGSTPTCARSSSRSRGRARSAA